MGKVIKKRKNFSGNALSGIFTGSHTRNLYGKLSDLYNYYGGFPLKYNIIRESDYKPTNSKNPNSEYISIDDNVLRQRMVNDANRIFIDQNLRSPDIKRNADMYDKRINDNTYSVSGYNDAKATSDTPGNRSAFGRFFISKGRDDKGEYISYYDIFDRSFGNDKSFDIGHALGSTKPYEIYDRIYVDRDDKGRFIQKGSNSKRLSTDEINIINRQNKAKGGQINNNMIHSGFKSKRIGQVKKMAYGGNVGGNAHYARQVNNVNTNFDYGTVGTSALSGAATGTSISPGWGTLIGGVIGAGAGIYGAATKQNAAIRESNAIDNANMISKANFDKTRMFNYEQRIGEDFSYYAKGGKININPKNKGKFTAYAKARGMGVQQMANKVMSNKEDYSPTIVKRANFARNAAKWNKADGGEIEGVDYHIMPDSTRMPGATHGDYTKRVGTGIEVKGKPGTDTIAANIDGINVNLDNEEIIVRDEMGNAVVISDDLGEADNYRQELAMGGNPQKIAFKYAERAKQLNPNPGINKQFGGYGISPLEPRNLYNNIDTTIPTRNTMPVSTGIAPTAFEQISAGYTPRGNNINYNNIGQGLNLAVTTLGNINAAARLAKEQYPTYQGASYISENVNANSPLFNEQRRQIGRTSRGLGNAILSNTASSNTALSRLNQVRANELENLARVGASEVADVSNIRNRNIQGINRTNLYNTQGVNQNNLGRYQDRINRINTSLGLVGSTVAQSDKLLENVRRGEYDTETLDAIARSYGITLQGSTPEEIQQSFYQQLASRLKEYQG